ncbi:MAG: DUF2961 domain-containing protein, partial [Cyclobacteriaceae bacterium]|nr:DUF2961 domain-containing protein [Cyclobacteriaceae bacterium]
GIGFIRIEENSGKKEWVIMEDEGPGVITKIWAVCFYYGLNNTTGANINFYLDGQSEPVISTNFFKLVKGHDFIKAPFADSTARAGNLYFPIPYAKSCKITMDQKAFYNIINYRKYPTGTDVETFTMEDFVASKDIRNNVAESLNAKPDALGEEQKFEVNLNSGIELEIDLPRGSNAVRQLEIKINSPENLPQALRSTVLMGSFDGNQTIWAPVGDFFNNVGKIRDYDMWERSVTSDGNMICRWVMPYKDSGQLALKNLGDKTLNISVRILTDSWNWAPNSMHFYATWQMEDPTPTFPLFDWNFLEATGKGVVVGDQWTVLNPREGWWGEGDEKIYIDDDIDAGFPSHFGTGTEDYYGWAGGIVPTPADEFAKPFLGNIIVAHPRSMGYNVCTRTRVLDAIPFQKRIIFDVESSCGTRQKWHFLQYSQTTFWYGIPGVEHNKPPLPKMASMTLPTLEGLQSLVEKAKNDQYVVDGALEVELLKISKMSHSTKENFAKIPMWGEMSNGDMKNLWFENPGDFAEVNLTEQFEKSEIQLCAAVGKNCGIFDIYVNGELKVTQDLYSNHGGMTNPYIKIENCQPVDNAYVIRFELKGHNEKAVAIKKKYALGLDFFLVKNDFLNR